MTAPLTASIKWLDWFSTIITAIIFVIIALKVQRVVGIDPHHKMDNAVKKSDYFIWAKLIHPMGSSDTLDPMLC